MPCADPPCPLACPTAQVLTALGYYFGVVGIEDKYVISNITGVPTYQLHDFVEVRRCVLQSFVTSVAGATSAYHQHYSFDGESCVVLARAGTSRVCCGPLRRSQLGCVPLP